jgi:hypothetical protein
VGVIGTGAIGKAFCRIAKGFGCEILAFDIFENEEMKALGVKYLPLQEVLAKSQIISLHCPLTPETKHLINADTIEYMLQYFLSLDESLLISARRLIGPEYAILIQILGESIVIFVALMLISLWIYGIKVKNQEHKKRLYGISKRQIKIKLCQSI